MQIEYLDLPSTFVEASPLPPFLSPPTLASSGGGGIVGGVKTTLIALLTLFLSLPLVAADKDKPLPKDFKSLKALAEEGDARAQLQMGHVYRRGEGVRKDSESAAKWYDIAAKNGSSEASYYLGVAYFNGSGVERDLVRAYVNLSIAARVKDARAIRVKERVAKAMTLKQIAIGDGLLQRLPTKEDLKVISEGLKALNKTLPKNISPNRRLDKVSLNPDNQVEYKFTFLKHPTSPLEVFRVGAEAVLKLSYRDGELKKLNKANVGIAHLFYLPNGKLWVKVALRPSWQKIEVSRALSPEEQKLVGTYEVVFPAKKGLSKLVGRRVLLDGGACEHWTNGKKSALKIGWRIEKGELLLDHEFGVTVIYKILPNDEIAQIGYIEDGRRALDKSPGKPLKRIRDIPLNQNAKPLPKDFKSLEAYLKALKAYFMALAEKGDAQAQADLGFMYAQGKGVERDFKEAVKWFRKSADQGNRKGQTGLAIATQGGLGGMEMNIKEALGLYRKSAAQGYPGAYSALGSMYGRGIGVERDLEEAIKLFRKAAALGDAGGQSNLGLMYRDGKGVKQDYKEAIKWFRKAAIQQGEQARSNIGGVHEAQNNLGGMYKDGLGVDKDFKEAGKWFRKAAEAGNVFAQMNLGLMYARGELGEVNFKKGIKWISKAARQGHPQAQTMLGQMYKEGKGVEQDFKEAVRCYRKSAEQGYANGQYSLGVMYGMGQGIEQDLVTAYAWASIAAANGVEIAPRFKAQFLEVKMTAFQIDEGQKLFRKMIKKNPKLLNK